MTPDLAQLERDVEAAPFLEGGARRRWRLITVAWPFAIFGVTAKDMREFALRLECSGYPTQPPTGGLWDVAQNAILAPQSWPRGTTSSSVRSGPTGTPGHAVLSVGPAVPGGTSGLGQHAPASDMGAGERSRSVSHRGHRHLNSRGYHGAA